MADFTITSVDEIEATNGIFRRVDAALGVSALGISIQDHAPEATMYPDHAEPDQEEAYLVLSGSGEIDIQGEPVALDPGVAVRVGPRTRHKVTPGPEGIRILAMGGIPGEAYRKTDFSQIEVDGPGADEPDSTVKRIDEMEASYGGGYRPAGRELGISSFGLGIIDLPAGTDQYPEHDHAEDGQEEIYVIVSGTGEIEVEGERHPLGPGALVRVGAPVRRKLWGGGEAMRMIALGAIPGEPYAAG